MPDTCWIKSIHTDNAFMCPAMKIFCEEKGIALTTCAPNTHQQNAIAETTVKSVKRVVRRNEVQARTGAKHRGRCYKYTGHQLNCCPSSTDPSGQMRSPVARWTSAPFYHASQELHPWGCLVHGFVGKRSENPNSAARANPGIYMGHSDDSAGHLVYHEDTDTVMTYGYVNAFSNVFPYAQRMIAGEDPSTIIVGDWRRWSGFRTAEVKDGPLSEWVTGKQIKVLFDRATYSGYTGQWAATCQRPITLASGIVCMRLVFSRYQGDKSKLSAKDKECLTPASDLWVDVPMSPQTQKALNKTVNGSLDRDLRQLLESTYPGTLALHEIATASVKATGQYPVSRNVRTAEDDAEDEDETVHLRSPTEDDFTMPSL